MLYIVLHAARISERRRKRHIHRGALTRHRLSCGAEAPRHVVYRRFIYRAI